MKKILTIIIVCCFCTLIHGEVRKKLAINANPINVAVVIIEKGDSAKIADLLDYYGYTLQGTNNGYQIMKDYRGNEIRYSFDDSESEGKYPKVIVKTNEKPKDIAERLHNLKFMKIGNIFEHTINRYDNTITQCSFGQNNTLIFQRIKY